MAQLEFNPQEHPDLTFSDAFLVPFNPAEERLAARASKSERIKLVRLQRVASTAAEESGAYIDENGEQDEALSSRALERQRELRAYVMVLAAKFGEEVRVVSRDEVDITPIDGFGNLPIVAANMNNVTGTRMAEAVAMMGGSAAIPQDKTDDEMRQIAEHLHSRDVRYQTPTVVRPDTKVHELKSLLQKRPIDTAIVLDDRQRVLGLVRMQKKDETRFGQGIIPLSINEDASVGDFMRPEFIVADEDINPEGMLNLMEDHRIDMMPVVGKHRKLKGVMTDKFAALSWRYKPHKDEENGGLAMLATVGAVNNDPTDRVKFLLDEVGAAGIVLDTAHFDQGLDTYRTVEKVAALIAQSRRKVFLVAGNVVTREAARNVITAGANAAKVGIGPGNMCSTRIETGVGRPQLSTILETADEAKKVGGHVWADGGILYPRDVALALAAGASQVMIGSLFTPTNESPTPFQRDQHGLYKVNRGMASRESSMLRTLGNTHRSMRHRFREILGHRSEGISESRIYARPGQESVMYMIHALMDGVTSSMTYMGARNMTEFARYARIGVQMTSGYEEGKPKDRL